MHANSACFDLSNNKEKFITQLRGIMESLKRMFRKKKAEETLKNESDTRFVVILLEKIISRFSQESLWSGKNAKKGTSYIY